MKILYSLAELKKLTPKELDEIMFFGEDFSASYGEIKEFTTTPSFTMKMYDNTEYNMSSKEHYNYYKQRKMRYDLVITTIQGNSADIKSKQEFRDELLSLVSEQVSLLQDTYNQNTIKLTQIAADIRDEAKTAISSLGDEISEVSSIYNKKLKDFDTFNINAYNLNMKNMEKVVDAFKELLKD